MKNIFKRAAKGFTIIELIVVITILAILAIIVLVNVAGWIAASKDTAAKSNMATLMTDAVTFYTKKTTFKDVLSDGDYVNAKGALTDADYTVTATCDVTNCGTDSTVWCACIQEKAVTTKYFCVDSAGNKKEGTTACADFCKKGKCQ